MPWNVSDVVDQRKRFVDDYKRGWRTMAELCRRYQISRETGFQRLERFRLEGAAGLQDRSRALLRHPNQTPVAIEERLDGQI